MRKHITYYVGLNILLTLGGQAQPLVTTGPETVFNTLPASPAQEGTAYLSSYSWTDSSGSLGSLFRIPSATGVVTHAEFLVRLRSEGGSLITSPASLTNTVFSLQVFRNLDDYGMWWGMWPWFSADYELGATNLSLTLTNSSKGQWLVGISNLPPFIWVSNRVITFQTSAADPSFPFARMNWVTRTGSASGASCHTLDEFGTLTARSGVPAMRLWCAPVLRSITKSTYQDGMLELTYAAGQLLGWSTNANGPFVWSSYWGVSEVSVDTGDTNFTSRFFNLRPDSDP